LLAGFWRLVSIDALLGMRAAEPAPGAARAPSASPAPEIASTPVFCLALASGRSGWLGFYTIKTPVVEVIAQSCASLELGGLCPAAGAARMALAVWLFSGIALGRRESWDLAGRLYGIGTIMPCAVCWRRCGAIGVFGPSGWPGCPWEGRLPQPGGAQPARVSSLTLLHKACGGQIGSKFSGSVPRPNLVRPQPRLGVLLNGIFRQRPPCANCAGAAFRYDRAPQPPAQVKRGGAAPRLPNGCCRVSRSPLITWLSLIAGAAVELRSPTPGQASSATEAIGQRDYPLGSGDRRGGFGGLWCCERPGGSGLVAVLDPALVSESPAAEKVGRAVAGREAWSRCPS